MIIFIGAKSTTMKKYFPFFVLMFASALVMTSCDSYHNVSADDGMYYNDTEYQDAFRHNQSRHTEPEQSTGKRQYIFEQTQNDRDQAGEYTEEEQTNDQARSYDNDSDYTTDPADLTDSYNRSRSDGDDHDVHVYVHYDTYWFWYRPRWYFYSPGIYFTVSYYGGFYDPWFYDPWCDPWGYDYVVINNYYGHYPYYTYYYYGYPYYPYYYGYPHYYGHYGGYYSGYPYVMYNTYVTNVRGPRGGRPSHIGTVISRDLMRKLHPGRTFGNGRDRSITGRNIRNAGVRQGRNTNIRTGIRNGHQNGMVRGGRTTRTIPNSRNNGIIRGSRDTRSIRNVDRIRRHRAPAIRNTRTNNSRTRRNGGNGRSYLNNVRIRGSHYQKERNRNNVHAIRSGETAIRSDTRETIRHSTPNRRIYSYGTLNKNRNKTRITRHQTKRSAQSVRTKVPRRNYSLSHSSYSSGTRAIHFNSNSTRSGSTRSSRSFGSFRLRNGSGRSHSSFGHGGGNRSNFSRNHRR